MCYVDYLVECNSFFFVLCMSGWSRFVVTVFLLFWSFLTVVVCLEPLSLFGTPIVSLEVVFFFKNFYLLIKKTWLASF